MKKTIAAGLFVSVIGILLIVLLPWTSGAQEKYLIRFSTGLPEDHFIMNQYKECATLIQQRSKGAIKVEIYFSAQLFKDIEVVRAVQMGAVESASSYSVYLSKSFPEYLIFHVPFLFKTTEELSRVAKSEIWDSLKKNPEKNSIKILAGFPWPQEAQGLISKKSVRVPSDCKGLIARIQDAPQSALIKLWGGGGSYLSGAELYMGLQRGTINSSFGSVVTVWERKLYEVAPYFTEVPWGGMMSIPIMNMGFFNKLPTELQNVVTDAFQEVEGRSNQRAMEEYNRALKMLKGKCDVYKPTKEEMILWEKDTRPIQLSSLEKVPDGAELLNRVTALLRK
jgi:TRAP-type C4-dicarboxylate transport system substrate-binding protein